MRPHPAIRWGRRAVCAAHPRGPWARRTLGALELANDRRQCYSGPEQPEPNSCQTPKTDQESSEETSNPPSSLETPRSSPKLQNATDE